MCSVHDNQLFAYSVDGVSKRIVLHTSYHEQSPVEYTDIVFDGVLDHMFRDVLLPSIIFDVERADTAYVLNQYLDMLAEGHRRGGWPSFYDPEVANMARKVSSEGCHLFTVTSSYGIDGWVVARSMRLKSVESGEIG